MSSSSNGWISVHRKMIKTSWYRNAPAHVLASHLLLSATHKDFVTKFGTREGTLLRGQYITGRYALAEETGLTAWEVRVGLKALKESGFLTIQSTNRYSVITICKYNAYQSTEPDVSQQFTPPDPLPPPPDPLSPPPIPPGTATKQQLTINNKQYISLFEELWVDYQNKDGKKEALRHFKASVHNEEDIANIKQALVNYNNSEKVLKGFVKMGSTWFNNWSDWITDPTSTSMSRQIEEIGAKYGLKPKQYTSKK